MVKIAAPCTAIRIEIFEIEAAGQALILSNRGKHLRGHLRIHFIDNSEGQGASVCDSSSVHEADLLVLHVAAHLRS